MMPGFFGRLTMTRPIVACTRISSTVVQWKNFASPPQCETPLLTGIGLLLRVGFLRGAAVAQAFDLEAKLDVFADDVGVARDAEIGALDRRFRREAGLLFETVRIVADAIQRELDID